MQNALVPVTGTTSIDRPAADVFSVYAAELDVSPKTRATYARALRQYADYLEVMVVSPTAATRETVLAYKKHLEETVSPATVNVYLTAVRSFYTWCESHHALPNIAAGIKGERRNKYSSKDALTIEQARRVLERADDGLESLRDHAMINLMTRRGLRTIEVSRADIGDIRQIDGKAVLWVQGKGYTDKGDFVVLGDTCLDPINEYLQARGTTDLTAPLFAGIGNRNHGGRLTTRTISQIAKDALKAAGIDSQRLTAHSLRHTAVTLALVGGATVQEAQAMARHASINTTMIYAHNLDRMSNAAESDVDRLLA